MAENKSQRLCDLCGKNVATMVVNQFDKDGNMTEIVVCAECAQRRGLSQVEGVKSAVAKLLEELKTRAETGNLPPACRRCGTTFTEFKRKGRLGCAECYAAFHEELVPILRRLHGAVQHVGKAPTAGRKSAQERLNAQRLREELKKAIASEDYEKAAALRDQLRQAGYEA
ncbi:MAG: UvrB/UvrC motif-containing protein [candidate division WOR-3 bacterium]